MPAPPPDARCFRSTIRELRPCGSDGVVLRTTPEARLAPLRAARFMMLRRPDALSPDIPRPFSVYRQLPDGDLEYLIKVMGRGTEALANSAVGDELVTVGPLGNGWPELDASSPWLMVAGGIGSAPFYMAIEQALASGLDAGALTLVYGAQSADLLYDIAAFEALGVRVLAATDDGSRGFHGNVVQCIQDQWERGDLPAGVRVLTCGPDPMMHAVARVAAQRSLDCWLSLETMMGCGVGICNGCAVETDPEGPLGDWPVAKCCVDGPVFPAAALQLG